MGDLEDKSIMNACCGHGKHTGAYIQYWSNPKKAVRGVSALVEQGKLLRRKEKREVASTN